MNIVLDAVRSGSLLKEGGVKFHVGQKIEGVVVSVSEEGLANISAGGRTITAATTGKYSLVTGETVRLEIVDVKGETVFANRIDSAETAVLHRLGVGMSEESVAMVSELLKLHQPIDREVLGKLLRNGQEVRMFLEQMEHSNDISVDVRVPLKDQLIQLFKQASSSKGESSGPGTSAGSTASAGGLSAGESASYVGGSGGSLSPAPASAPISETASAVSVPSGNTVSFLNEGSPKDFSVSGGSVEYPEQDSNGTGSSVRGKELAVEAELAGSTEDSADQAAEFDLKAGTATERKTFGSKENRPTEPAVSAGGREPEKEAALVVLREALRGGVSGTELGRAVKILLSEFSAAKNISIVRSGRPLSPQTIAAATLGTSDLADELLSLAKLAERSEQIVELSEVLAARKEQESKIAELSRILGRRDAELLSEASKIVSKQDHAQIYYIPLPVKIDREDSRVDLYYKRRSRKGEDLSILVALRTHHLGEVRCLLQRTGEEFFLGFALENEGISDLFRAHMGQFRSRLKLSKPFQIVIRTRESVDHEFFEGSEGLSDFDVRV